MDSRAGGTGWRSDPPPSLEVVWAELNQLLVEDLALDEFLHRLGDIAASLVPGAGCVVTVRPEAADEALSVGSGSGPDRSEGTGVPGQRRPGPGQGEASGGTPREAQPPQAVARQARSRLSVPLVASGVHIGVMWFFSESAGAFRAEEVERLQSFGRLAAPAVMLVLRESAHAHVVLDDQLQEAVVTRAVIDQALGVLMHARKISSREAFEELRHASQATNRKVSEIAAEVIVTLTGHAVEPPRPLAPSRELARPDSTGT